ncbi:MAG: nitroreductase/dihydropteridine reductase [Gammaproteobacteria bacterium]|jgi:nitroreductase/dihydropteridine reductase
MELLDALNWRYAVKQFSEDIIPDCVIADLVRATSLTPSCYGLQPYQIIQVNDLSLREKLLDHSWGQDKVLECSHLLVFAVSTAGIESIVDRYLRQQAQINDEPIKKLKDFRAYLIRTLGGKSNEQVIEWAHRQAYIALGNLLTSAAVKGIDTCPMEGIDPAGFDQVLGLQSLGLTTSVVCALGYRNADDKQALKPKIRFANNDFLREV